MNTTELQASTAGSVPSHARSDLSRKGLEEISVSLRELLADVFAPMSIHKLNIRFALALATLTLLGGAATQSLAAPIKNIVLVHGAWVDGSGWKPVYEILTRDGYSVTMVQLPETSFQDDVAATKRILDLQTGPCILVGHSYGGSIITEAGVDSHVAGLVYVAAHAPDVGEDEGALGKGTPSVLAKTKGAVEVTADSFTYLNPADFPKLFAPDLPREQAEFESRSQVLAAAKVFNSPLSAAAWKAKPSWGIVAGSDQIINPDLEKWYYNRAHSHWIVIQGASHSVYESHPKEVAAVIEEAAQKPSKKTDITLQGS
jgi:pimeloyl-ACP methyl ester carboxylesterase